MDRPKRVNSKLYIDDTSNESGYEEEDEYAEVPRKKMKKLIKKKKPISSQSKTDDGDDEIISTEMNSSALSETQPKYSEGGKSSSSSSPALTDVDIDEDEEHEADSNTLSEKNPTGQREPGQIIEITVENFMCHRKLTVEFCSHVNFVTGQNGSGKSAIVAAVQLCLGGSASNTGRGSNMKSLIREGSEGPAVITIKLFNEGPDAYESHIFGNRIWVRRRIHKTGASDYTMMKNSSTGIKKMLNLQAVYHGATELEKMLTQFNICVSNPVCVLTQEASKLFIKGKEEDKYSFFLKATGLHQTNLDINAAEMHVNQAATKSRLAEEQLKKKQEVVRALEKEVREVRELLRLKDDIDEIEAKLLWRAVQDADVLLEEAREDKAQKEKEFEQMKLKLQQLEDSTTDDREMEQCKDLIDSITKQMEESKEDLEAKKNALKESTAILKAAQNAISQAENHKNQHSRRLETVRGEIRVLRAKAIADSEGQERILREAADHAAIEIERAEAERHLVSSQRAECQEFISNAQREVDQMGRKVHLLQADVRALAEDIDNMSRTGGGTNERLKLFSYQMPDIMIRISQTIFKDEVIGPIGMHVAMKDGYTKYQHAVEKQIGREIRNFIVRNGEDQTVLAKIFTELNCGYNHSVIVQKKHPRYNVPPTPQPFTGVLDCVTIDNDSVFNALVDLTRIESVAVTDTNETLKSNLLNNVGIRGKVEFKSREISKIILSNGCISIIRNGNEYFEFEKEEFRRLLAKDLREMLAARQEQLEHRNVAETDARAQLNQHSQVLNKAKQDLVGFDKCINQLSGQLKDFSRRKAEAEHGLRDLQAAKVIDTSDLEAEQEDLVEAIESVSRQVAEQTAKLSGLKNTIDGHKFERDKADRVLQRLKEQLDEQDCILSRFVESHESRRRQVEKVRKAVAEREKAQQSAAILFESEQKRYNHVVADATEKTPLLIKNWDGNPLRVNQNETTQRLEAIKKAKEIKLTREREQAGISRRGSLESILRKFEQQQAELKKCEERHEKMLANISMLFDDLVQRKSKWSATLTRNAKEVSRRFDEYTGRKNWRGKVFFDHVNQRLHLATQTDSADATTQHSDVRGMSGGERSFTTLCLLQALCNVVECPFHIMDEYDVFLDEATRKSTLDSIIDCALKINTNRGRQFFVITPQNLDHIKSADGNEIIIRKLAAPQRTATSARSREQLLVSDIFAAQVHEQASGSSSSLS